MGYSLTRLTPKPSARPLRFALPLAPEGVVAELLADPRVAEACLSTLGTLRGPTTRFVLERSERGFMLAGRAWSPGVWEPGAYAVLEGRVEGRVDGGSELVLRARLHPLTRAAYLSVAGVTLLIIPLQFWTTGLLLGTAMMFPIVLAAMVVGLDSRRLANQRASLQRLVEEIFAPLALARELGDRGPFRCSGPQASGRATTYGSGTRSSPGVSPPSHPKVVAYYQSHGLDTSARKI